RFRRTTTHAAPTVPIASIATTQIMSPPDWSRLVETGAAATAVPLDHPRNRAQSMPRRAAVHALLQLILRNCQTLARTLEVDREQCKSYRRQTGRIEPRRKRKCLRVRR